MEKEFDNVNRPKHYIREGGMECIDEMILLFGVEEVKSFCKLNAWKYRYRAAEKNGEEDLRKSDWYLRKYKELCGSEVKITTPLTISSPTTPPNTINPPDYPWQTPYTPSNPYEPYITWTCATKDNVH